MPLGSEERHAVVTGAASGIGNETARLLSRLGWRVSACDIDVTEITDSKGRGVAPGSGWYVEAVDVSHSDAVCDFLSNAVNRSGKIDLLVSSAGICPPDISVADQANEQIARVIEVNLVGAILICKYAVSHLREHGSIVIVGSTSGLDGHPGAAVYAASKIGLIGFARSLALELSSQGIRVNTVCPGAVDTPLLRGLFSDDERDSRLETYVSMNPLRQLATTVDIAEAIIFLSSAKHINGTALRIDGGDGLSGSL